MHLYFNELLNAENETRFCNTARMNKDCFLQLVTLLSNNGGLKHTKISNCVKIMMCIYVLSVNSYRDMASQHFNDSQRYSWNFANIRKLFMLLTIIASILTLRIALEHLMVHIFQQSFSPASNRKGCLSQNVLWVAR